jgi:hypothetical protein
VYLSHIYDLIDKCFILSHISFFDLLFKNVNYVSVPKKVLMDSNSCHFAAELPPSVTSTRASKHEGLPRGPKEWLLYLMTEIGQFQKMAILKKFDDGQKQNLNEYSRYFPMFSILSRV